MNHPFPPQTDNFWGKAHQFMTGMAGLTLLLLLVKSWVDLCPGTDSWIYHIPFAAKLHGLLPDSVFTLDVVNRHRLDGFPVLAQWLEGLLWKLTGHMQATNLLAPLSLTGLCFFANRAMRLPFAVTVFGLLTIPQVMLQASTSYVDLFANAAATCCVLSLVLRILSDEPGKRNRWLAAAIAFAAIATNSKFQLLLPVHAVMIIALIEALVFQWRQTTDRNAFFIWLARWVLPVVLLCVVILDVTLIKNFLFYRQTTAMGNPVYPVAIHFKLLGLYWPGPEAVRRLINPGLDGLHPALAWLFSLLEWGRTTPWNMHQWDPYLSKGFLMGGYWNLYVLLNVLLLAVHSVWHASKRYRVALLFMAVLTLAVANSPQSHELRYSMVWMMSLVCFNAWLWLTPDSTTSDGVASAIDRKRHIVASLFVFCTAVYVGWVCDFHSYLPAGHDLNWLSNQPRNQAFYHRVFQPVMSRETSKKTRPVFCVVLGSKLIPLMLASSFHPEWGQYQIKQVWDEKTPHLDTLQFTINPHLGQCDQAAGDFLVKDDMLGTLP